MSANLNSDQFDAYRGQHQPSPNGVPMHQAEQAYPDIHEHPEWHTSGQKFEIESARHITKVRNNPDATVMIHRAVPPGVTEINHGDWVTTSKSYAQQHAMHDHDPAQDMPVISKKVKAADLRTDGDYLPEWGYFPGGDK